MNSYYKVVELLRIRLVSNPDVNTILHCVPENIDIDKKNIYPLAVINPVNSTFQEGVIIFDFEIYSLDQRDISKKQTTDKFVGNDNEIDNLNACHNVLNDLITWLRLQRNNEDIELFNNPTLTPIQMQFTNLLDGWVTNVQLSIPNLIEVC